MLLSSNNWLVELLAFIGAILGALGLGLGIATTVNNNNGSTTVIVEDNHGGWPYWW